MAHKTPTIPRATITVSRATTTILNVTPNVSGTTSIFSPTAPTVPAASPAIAARNAWYTARMPWLRNAHRHTKTRWTLTVLTLLTLAAWIVTRWGGVVYTNADGWIARLCYGSAELYAVPREMLQGQPGVQWVWNAPEWRYFVSFFNKGSGDWYVLCTLLLPFLLLVSTVSWLWYRRWRPANRPDRPNRSRQFTVTRWAFTVVPILLIAVAASSHSYVSRFRSQGIDIYAARGTLMVTHTTLSMPPDPALKRWSIEPVKPRPATAGGKVSGFSLVVFSSFATGGFMASLSIWFLAVLLAVPAMVLWRIRLRRYPSG